MKHRRSVRHVGKAGGFPLGKTGGLIEAPIAMRGPAGRAYCFRWVKPAASLKLEAGCWPVPAGHVVSAG